MANILPFVPRKTEAQLEQDHVVATIEALLESARNGDINGIIFATKDKAGVLEGEIATGSAGCGHRECGVMWAEMTEICTPD